MPPASLPIAFSLIALSVALYVRARGVPAFLVVFLAVLVRWLVRRFPIISYDYRHSRIRRRQVCPACANAGLVEIRFDAAARQVVCQCKVCLACWAYNPVVKPEKWANLPKVEE